MQRRILYLHGDGLIREAVETLPEPAAHEITVEIKASLISPGTEMVPVRALRETPRPDAPPRTFGYAAAGIVRAVNGDGRGLVPGDRVAVMGPNARHADRVNVPVNLVAKLPEKVAFEEGAFACLGATALHALRRAEPQLGDYILILGAGIVGNLAAQLARIAGTHAMVWETMPGRRKLARRCGLAPVLDPSRADCAGRAAAFAGNWGFDAAIFAFGGRAEPAFRQVEPVMKLSADGHRMGKIVLVGGCKLELNGGAAGGNLDVRVAARTGPGYHDRNWEYGQDYPHAIVPYTTRRNLEEVLFLIAARRLRVRELITDRMPLGEADRAADLLLNTPDRAMGIVLQP